MGFFTIFPAEGLDEIDHQRALSSGPSAVSTGRRGMREILGSAGFTHVVEEDVTREFLETARNWYQGRERHAEEIADAMGRECFRQRQEEARMQIDAVERGLLRRAMFIAW